MAEKTALQLRDLAVNVAKAKGVVTAPDVHSYHDARIRIEYGTCVVVWYAGEISSDRIQRTHQGQSLAAAELAKAPSTGRVSQMGQETTSRKHWMCSSAVSSAAAMREF
jgi:hypothetical protein